jgi:hypothetical protein
MRLTIAFLLALPLLGSDQFDGVREFIRKGLVETGMPSIAVAVSKGRTIVWEEGFGWADREKRVPATEHTMYSLASISKPFTATGLMILVQEGRVNLDRPANEYLGKRNCGRELAMRAKPPCGESRIIHPACRSTCSSSTGPRRGARHRRTKRSCAMRTLSRRRASAFSTRTSASGSSTT